MLRVLLLLSFASAAELAGEELSPTLQAIYGEVERLSAIEVQVSSGVVRLVGEVPTPAAREEAEQIAASREGVVFVDNQLLVASDATLEEDEDKAAQDEQLEAQLRGIYSQVEELSQVEVEVASGVVRLSGEVLDAASHERAVAVAGELEGIVYVDDDLAEITDVSDRLRPTFETALGRARSALSKLPLLAVAMVVLALFALLAWAISRQRLYGRLGRRPLLAAMIARVLRLVVLLVGVVAALEIMDATSLVSAVLGTAGIVGLAVGFAFQDIVENYLAGILLSLQQPFSKDDFIEVGGVQGVVVRLTMRNTLLLTLEGNHAYLPNARVFKGQVVNFTRNPRRRFDFDVGVGVTEDLSAVIQLAERTLRQLEGVLDEPPPRVYIRALGDFSVVLQVTAWVDQRQFDYLGVRTEGIRRVKHAFDAAGIDMPEPVRRVVLYERPPEAKPVPSEPGPPALDLSSERDLSAQVEEERNKGDGDDLLDR